MTITISLPIDAETQIRQRAKAAGQDLTQYVEALLIEESVGPVSLIEAAGPIGRAVDAAGVMDDEFTATVLEALDAVRQLRGQNLEEHLAQFHRAILNRGESDEESIAFFKVSLIRFVPSVNAFRQIPSHQKKSVIACYGVFRSGRTSQPSAYSPSSCCFDFVIWTESANRGFR